MSRWHLGRCWRGNEKEWFVDECTCAEMAPCGASRYDPEGTCPQHNDSTKTMRRAHREEQCPNTK